MVLVFVFFLVCTAPGASSKHIFSCSSSNSCGNNRVCQSGLCFIRRDSRCKISSSVPPCEPKTKCVHGVCRRTATLGQTCRRKDDYRDCDNGLECDNNVCKLSNNGNCTPNPGSCATGLLCVGRAGKKRCRKPMQAGGRCRTDPYWICAKNLVCGDDNICRVRRGDSCLPQRVGNDDDDDDDDDKKKNKSLPCVKGTECIGSRTVKKCEKANAPGGACAIVNNPTAICESGLICEKKVCKVPKDKSCLRNGKPVECISGTKCVGSDQRKTCRGAVGVGGPCKSPFKVCADKLKCEARRCKLLEGESCEKRIHFCAGGLHCVGPAGLRKCYKLVKVNGKCSSKNLYAQCAAGLLCSPNKKVCLIKIGGSCNGNEKSCVDEATCLGPKNKRRCIVRRKVGQTCSTKPLSLLLCKIGLKCENKSCRIPVGGDCLRPDVSTGSKLGNNNGCVRNAQCVGSKSKKTCRIPAGPGASCDTNPSAGKICSSILKCEDGKCKIRAGHDCAKYPNACENGSTCIQHNKKRKRCKNAVPLGGKCGSKTTAPCAKGLQCDRNRCKLPRGAECDKKPSLCMTGLLCVLGNGRKKVCKKVLKLGERCTPGQTSDPACGLDAECYNNRCRIREGASCEKFSNLCSRDLRCVGKKGHRKCKKPVNVGGSCKSDAKVCRADLKCNQGVCRIAEGRECKIIKGLKNNGCITGTACVNDQCKKQAPLNAACRTDSRGGDCAPGLVCDDKANGKLDTDGRCKVPAKGSCKNNRGNPCVTGTLCFNGKCLAPSPPGGKCNVEDGPECAAKSMCQDGVCRLRRDAACTTSTREFCGKGLVCVGDGKSGTKRCKPRVGLLQKCDTDRNVGRICQEDLECDGHDFKCRISHDENCNKTPHACATNTKCVGSGKNKVCKNAMQAGEKCTVDPLWVCDDGLLCQDHVCKVKVGGACNIPMHECAKGMRCGPSHVCVW